MGTLLIIVIVAAVVLVAAGIVVSQMRRPQPKGPAETTESGDAWELYLSKGGAWSEHDREAIAALRQQPQAEQDRIRQAVQQAEAAALSAPEPQTALRQAVMEATDRFVLAEAGGNGDVASVVEAGALRCAAWLRFKDYDQEDWYAHYLRVARMNSRNVAAMVRKTVEGDSSSMESALHEPLTRTMAEVRQKLLTHPPRTPVARSDRLTGSAESKRLSPTQREIDGLTRVMTDRFEKLFAGQVYRLDGAAADPTGTFQIDASLLYTLLAVNFRHSTDAWRQIMTEALGDYRAAMGDEERLLALAHDCRRSWEDHPDGSLDEMVLTGCRGAFANRDDQEALAAGLMEDATFLSGQIQRVLRES